MQIQEHLMAGCRRLAAKGLLQSSSDSFSLRIPGECRMLFVSGLLNWRDICESDLRTIAFDAPDNQSKLHAAVYSARSDVGAIALSSPRGARLLAGFGGVLPTLFDEQARHIGTPSKPVVCSSSVSFEKLCKTFSRQGNAAISGTQLLCIGMTCERVLFNSELFEKCAQAYVIARASGYRIGRIPWWVRLIANRRLIKDQRNAALSYQKGLIPENIGGY